MFENTDEGLGRPVSTHAFWTTVSSDIY